jgi:hypothetical protein
MAKFKVRRERLIITMNRILPIALGLLHLTWPVLLAASVIILSSITLTS